MPPTIRERNGRTYRHREVPSKAEPPAGRAERAASGIAGVAWGHVAAEVNEEAQAVVGVPAGGACEATAPHTGDEAVRGWTVIETQDQQVGAT